MPATRVPDPAVRLGALDGLRGVAAVVVMLYHLSLIARPALETGRTGDAWWWLTRTPLKLATAGTESVLVFFVLSGMVLTLPALRPGFSWRAYAPTRMLRLYLPVWAALALSVALVWLAPRDAGQVTAGTWLADTNAHTVQVPQLLSEASLWRASYDYNNVLWSLRWELVFSLALPLFVAAALLTRHLAPMGFAAVVALLSALTVLGRVADIDALVYLPVFFAGTLMAVHLGAIRRWSRRRSTAFWRWFTALALLLLVASFLARDAAPAGSRANSVVWGLSGIGAALLLLSVIGSPALSTALSSAVPRALGRISFSLYLVHVPVLATVSWLVGDEHWGLIALVSLPLCPALAWLFFRGVERPSHALARRVGRYVAALPAPTLSPTRG